MEALLAPPSFPLPLPGCAAGVAPDVVGLHAQLLRFAKSQLRNATLAEDAVSESILAALAAPHRFASKPQATAWVFGILRHKLVDQLRQQRRESPVGDLALEIEADRHAWRGAGCWTSGTSAMNDPEQACRQSEFVNIVSVCCQRLPPHQAQAFVMRDVWGLDASAISEHLDVTEGHVWVLLHRARRRLRLLVGQQWPLYAS